MKIIIVGDGKIGFALTKRLAMDGHDIVVIDRNARVLEESQQAADIMTVQGSGASMDVLKEAGIQNADLLIAATSSDEINILCCMMASKISDVHTIARVRSPEYSKQLNFLKKEMGLSMTFSPEQETAQEIFHLLQFPSFLKRDRFANGRVEIVEIKVTKDSVLCSQPLKKLNELVKVRVLVCAVERDNTAYIPSGNFVLEENDNIYVTAVSRELSQLVKNLGLFRERVKQVLIIGGSRSSFYLSNRLISSGVLVKIIERDSSRCAELSAMLPKASIICGDGSRQEVLSEEGIDNADALITLTDFDEENLIISLFAAQRGVPKVITKVNREEYIDTFQNFGIDTFINPKQLTCSDIVRYVRAMENTTGGSMQALHYIVGGRVEALEFFADNTTDNLQIPLKDLQLKPNILIASINRSGHIIIPSGIDFIQAGDTVVVVAKAQQAIYDLNDIFA